MNILDSILGAQGGGATQQLGQQFGLNQDQVATALSALVPALAAGFNRNMSSPQGLDGLILGAKRRTASAIRRRPGRARSSRHGVGWQRDSRAHLRQQRCQPPGGCSGRIANRAERKRSEKHVAHHCRNDDGFPEQTGSSARRHTSRCGRGGWLVWHAHPDARLES